MAARTSPYFVNEPDLQEGDILGGITSFTAALSQLSSWSLPLIVLLQVHPAPTGDGRLPLSTTTPTPILLRCAKGNVATNAICDKLDIFVLSVA